MNAAIPRSRFIILGASNVARGLPSLVRILRRLEGQPVEILAASGHGRSYGQASTVLGRTLPSILDCGLWRALEERPPLPTYSLVADIGNDILFGTENRDLLEWVETALDRLRNHDAETVLVPPPVESLRSMPHWFFPIIRTFLYPRSRLGAAEGLEKAEDLVRGLEDLADEREIPTVAMAEEWMSFDCLHIRLRMYPEVWPILLAPWGHRSNRHRPAEKPFEWLRLRRAGFERRRLFGINQGARQPAFTWPDGTTLSLY